MQHEKQFYIDGAWVDPVTPNLLDVIDPSNEDAFAQISLGSKADVDKAVAAAKRAFRPSVSPTSKERLDLLNRIIEVYKKRSNDLALAVSREMGAPRQFALDSQVGIGLAHLEQDGRDAEELRVPPGQGQPPRGQGADRRRRPDHAVELAAQPDHLQGRPGARRRLHHGAEADARSRRSTPSSSPRSSTRPACRRACSTSSTATARPSARRSSSHPDVDMMSFTGSTRAGILVAKAAADTVKRVHQELGGKSANILFDDVDLPDGRHQGRRRLLRQQRPVLQRADPHVRAARPA